MKTKYILLFFLLISFTILTSGQSLIKVWETQPEFKVPESVTYDVVNNIVYVANINGSATEKDGNGFISKMTTEGKIKKLEWVTGLNAPKGMAIYQGKLYVADIDQLVEIDISKGKILNKYDMPGAVFLNDVAACLNGMIFVSDTRTGKIYVLDDNDFSLWLEDDKIVSPNGLLADMGTLFIGGKSIFKANISTKEITIEVEDTGGIDGLEKTSSGNFLFSHWSGRIFIQKNEELIKLLDTSEQGKNTADIDYILKSGLVLVPTFSDNRVTAYKLEE